MSENLTSTEMASQYAAQVAGDLDRNAKEQERISAKIATLQEQLTALQHDHGMLVNIQQALAGTAPGDKGATVPSPRTATASEPAGGKRTRAGNAAAPRKRTAERKPAAKKTPATKAAAKGTAGKSATPTLVELVRRHLTAQSEPRSAAEVCAALVEAHPERPVQTTVVRNTLENLVAKQQVQRSKQGSSVYYTAAGAPESATASASRASAEDAK